MKVVGADDNFRFPVGDAFNLVPPFARRLHRSFHGFRTGVHGQSHVHSGEIVKLLVQERQLLIAKGAGSEGDLAGLLS